ncbi:MAG: hypothetical protein ACRDE8_00550 [Ginsengibacter sp.]
MQRIFIFFLTGLLFFSKSFGQIIPSDKHILDSLLQNDEMLKMINNYTKNSSYVRVSAGVGNRLYGNQDKSIESLQNSQTFVVTPSVGYYHKSGFGISFAGFLLNENDKTDFYQYTLTPSYSYNKGKVADILISYTHYFEKSKYSYNTSPVQNEFYGNVLFKKPWLKPGIALGYATGKFDELIHIDTTVRILTQLVHIIYSDTITTKISSYSMAGSVEHSFMFFDLLSAKDGIILTPQLSLISGINTYNVSHTSNLANFNAFTKKRLKRIRHFQSQLNNKNYELQSVGLDLDVNYSIGKFYFEPDLYINYYLPDTNDDRFTQIFNFNIGITF